MDTTSRPNTDFKGLIDHLKWLYFAQSRPLAFLHYRLAELAGTGKLDPEANRELQHELSEISQTIWSGTHSFLERENYVLEDQEWYYIDGTEIIHKFPATDEQEAAWPFRRYLNGDGAVHDYPRLTRFWLRDPLDRTSVCPDPKDLPFIGSEVK